MTVDARDVHIATGKLLQFIEEQKIGSHVAEAGCHSAAETLHQTQLLNERLLMMAQYFKPQQS